MISKPIIGFVAAPFTAMNHDGSLNLEVIPAYARHLAENGIAGAFVNGTTGEGYSLSVAERIAAAEAWIAHRPAGVSIIVHVGAESIVDAKNLAKHAEQTGADAIGAMAPVFFRPGLDALVAYCAEIASAAPSLPFYYYHIPSMTGAAVAVLPLLERAAVEIPTFRGVKFTHNDLMEYGLCRSFENERFDMLFGRDEILLSALVLGAKGMVGSTYNYAMPVFNSVLAAFDEGRPTDAAEAQKKAMSLVQILARNGGLSAGKALMSGVGLEMGPCRAPNRSLDARTTERIVAEARAIGVFGDSGPEWPAS